MNQPHTYHLTLPSHPESIRLVDPFLKSIQEVAATSAERYHDVLLALTEAVNNAIIHGNRFEASKPVTVEVQVDSRVLVAVVTDHGSGFDADRLPDPTDPENILREGGRGVFLIRHLAQSVEFRRTADGMAVMIKLAL